MNLAARYAIISEGASIPVYRSVSDRRPGYSVFRRGADDRVRPGHGVFRRCPRTFDLGRQQPDGLCGHAVPQLSDSRDRGIYERREFGSGHAGQHHAVGTAVCNSFSYVEPRSGLMSPDGSVGCIIPFFYIQPQLEPRLGELGRQLYSIIFLHRTTTPLHRCSHRQQLYNIIVLHQTTTISFPLTDQIWLYNIIVLHQTTTVRASGCNGFALYNIGFLHQTTTTGVLDERDNLLYNIIVLHQTTTSSVVIARPSGCIISLFYIKPQRDDGISERLDVV